MVTVYSKSHCVQCNATKRQLAKLGVEYTEINLEQDQQALERFKAAGFVQAPIVVTDDETWSGYRPDLLKKVAQTINA
ncbi:glutaredoxin-like protein NrdH [Alloscardovia theropitheci]|uniref:Glutaredoxin-like protein NrdH n=1 Tax=Alloscardovia theropitheci TaxID=2496842 RepID=A0A4R0QZK2_9BIFI|nr:glutaredoxin-like protein NrdH [Alloscardovia theropitheci]TCD54086.1 glutaredoxin-like protein NrdH [Alloscardovia theropitheci]